MEDKMVCLNKNCQSTHVVKHGSVATVKKGKQQRFKCQDCGKTFYNEDVE
jgi:transposase-like protein